MYLKKVRFTYGRFLMQLFMGGGMCSKNAFYPLVYIVVYQIMYLRYIKVIVISFECSYFFTKFLQFQMIWTSKVAN